MAKSIDRQFELSSALLQADRINNQHLATIKALREKIEFLENEIYWRDTILNEAVKPDSKPRTCIEP